MATPDLKSYKSLVLVVSCLLLIVQAYAVFQSLSSGSDNQFPGFYRAGNLVRTHQLEKLYSADCRNVFDEGSLPVSLRSCPFERPAYEALFFVPFSFLPFKLAFTLFFLLNAALLGVCTYLLIPYFENFQQIWPWMPAAVFFLFLPAALAAGAGQDSFLLLLIFVIAAVSFYRNRDWSSGLCLGLALFQFQFAIPVALLFLLFKRWRIFCGFCISAVTVAGISAAMAGARGTQRYMQSMVSRFSPGSVHTGASIDRAAIPNIRCLLSLLFGAHIGPEVLFALILACSVLLILWAGTRTPNFALATMVAVLVSFKGNIGETVLLLLPIAFVLDARLAIFSGWRRTWMRNLVALLFIAPSLLYLVKLPYCLLVFLMLPLLMPLRFASSDWQPRPSQG